MRTEERNKINRWKLFNNFFPLFLSPFDDTLDIDWSKGKGMLLKIEITALRYCLWHKNWWYVNGNEKKKIFVQWTAHQALQVKERAQSNKQKWIKRLFNRIARVDKSCVFIHLSWRWSILKIMLIIACCTRFPCLFRLSHGWCSYYGAITNWKEFICIFVSFFLSEKKKGTRDEKNIPQIGTTWDDSILPQLVQSRSIDRFHFICWRNLKQFLTVYFEHINIQREKYWKYFRKHLRAIVSKLETIFSRSVSLLISLSPCVLFFYVHAWRVRTWSEFIRSRTYAFVVNTVEEKTIQCTQTQVATC